MGFGSAEAYLDFVTRSKVWAGCRKVLFVGDWGNDSYAGTDMDKPVTTLEQALTNGSKYGYNRIYLLENPTDTTYPIDVNVENCHIIGFPWVLHDTIRIVPPADTAGLSISKNKVTVEGLHIGGGTNHGCIEFSGTRWLTTIKNCMFGHINMAGKYGIKGPANTDVPYIVVTGCLFGHALTSHAIELFNATRGFIGMPENGNIFRLTLGGKGIYVTAGAGHDLGGIFDNRFMMYADTKGLAITLVAGGAACFVDGNRAAYGTASQSNRPYLDTGAAHWGLNSEGEAFTLPATA